MRTNPAQLLTLLGGVAASVLISGGDPQARPILITSQLPNSLDNPCLRSSYYGSYGGSASSQDHIFIADSECFNDLFEFQALSEGGIGALTGNMSLDTGRLVWVGPSGMEEASAKTYPGPSTARIWWHIIQSRSVDAFEKVSKGDAMMKRDAAQHPMFVGHSDMEAGSQDLQCLCASDNSLLLYVPPFHQPLLDTYLPAYYVPVALPVRPFQDAWEPVPKHLAKNLANITAHVKFDAQLDKVLSQSLDVDQLRRDIRWLTGEAPSGIESRHSFTEGAVKAAHHIKACQVKAELVQGIAEDSGASCHLFHFLPGFAPDVICHYPSQTNSTEKVILSAHYDSRGSFGMTRAPGGDDDGSGSGHLLQIARAVGASKLTFEKSVTFAWFAGEEQGLYGSHYYAEHLRKQNATVLLHIQADMLGYHVPGEPLQLGLPESIETPEASDLLRAISSLYSPELLLGKTAACCSDHQSFLSYGFPATAVFERNGPIADPMYHNSGDLSQREGYDMDQIISIAKVTMGAVLTVAGWSVGQK